jgi:uncharacterized protein YutE (UPF0331/DUF86 family)
MVDEDIIFEKIANIQSCLKRIKDKTQLNPKTLDDIDVQDIFVLNLQRAIQSTIDLAAHIIAEEGLGLPESLRDNFVYLEDAGIIPDELAKKMVAMTGFRNIAVDEYQKIEIKVLSAILTDHLQDLEAFYQAILSHCGLAINRA